MYVQAEQCRQRHPLWKPGGNPHLPAGAVCRFGGLYQVSYAVHMKTFLLKPSQWSAMFNRTYCACAERDDQMHSESHGISFHTPHTYNTLLQSDPQSILCLIIFLQSVTSS